MYFKDFCELFSNCNNDVVNIFKYIFSPSLEFFKTFYADWNSDDSERKAIQNMISEPPKRFGTNYKNLYKILKTDDNFIKWRKDIDEYVIPNISNAKLLSFISAALEEIESVTERGGQFSTTLLLLNKYIKNEVPHARSTMFTILVLYSIYGKDFFHQYFSWTYNIEDEFCSKIYDNIFTIQDYIQNKDFYYSSKQISTQTVNDGNSKKFTENIKLRSNTNYIGYDNEQKILQEYMNKYNAAFIYGMGGIGKTETVKQYACNHKNKYSKIVFLTYESDICQMLVNDNNFHIDGITRQFDEKGVPETDMSYSRRKLAAFINANTEKTLVVVDNFDTSYDPLLKELLSGFYSVIITTRNDLSHLGIPVIELKGLEKTAQHQLFRRYYKKKMSDEEQKLLPSLLELLMGHPLAIELTAKLMQKKLISIKKMTEIIENDGITPKLKGDIPHGFERSDTLYNNIKKIFNLDSLSSEEKQILVNMTLLPIKGFDIEQFAMLSGLEDCEKIMSLAEQSWVFYYPESNCISLHPLIADVVKQELLSSIECVSGFLEKLTHVTDNTWGISALKKCQYSEIALSILHQFPAINFKYIRLYRNIAIILMRTEHFDLSSELFQKCLNYTYDKFGENSNETAEFYYLISDNYVYMGDLINAVKYIDKSISVMEKLQPLQISLHSSEITRAYYTKYKAWILLNNSNSENLSITAKLLKKTADILESVSDNSDARYLENKASLYSAYAYYYYYCKDYETALDYADKSFNIFLNLFGKNHPDTMSPLTAKAMIYSKTGLQEKAVSLMKDIISAIKKIFPEHSQKITLKYNNLASIYYNTGQLQLAVETLKKVCREFETDYADRDIIYKNAKYNLSAWETELQKNISV